VLLSACVQKSRRYTRLPVLPPATGSGLLQHAAAHYSAVCAHQQRFFGRKCVDTGLNFKSPDVSAYSQIADFNVTDYCLD